MQRAGLLGETCWSAANWLPSSSSCPWYSPEQSPAAHTSMVLQCLDLAAQMSVCEGWVCALVVCAKCQLAEVKRMTPTLETLSSSGMGRESESCRAGSAVHSSMTHHAVNFWPYLQYVPLHLGLLVFRQSGQCLWSWTFTSLVCHLFSISGFFLALGERGGEHSLLNWAPTFPYHRQPLTSGAWRLQAGMCWRQAFLRYRNPLAVIL